MEVQKVVQLTKSSEFEGQVGRKFYRRKILIKSFVDDNEKGTNKHVMIDFSLPSELFRVFMYRSGCLSRF